MQNIDIEELSDYCEKSYLDYSMQVVMDRALPHVGDGLKPVQRRIVYAMSELGLNSAAKYKKSARTVGDVLGKFHPHGDSACYEAMVLMAQPFSYRYPLVDGQGNWGSKDDPKSFAAMRYTEARLTKYTDLLLSELKFDTVSWKSNFDGTLKEPVTLPSQVPNILLNGASGIAVGMSTDIPSHNLNEVIDATIHILENPNCSISDLMLFVKGPDFPTEAEIVTPSDQIVEAYSKGNGSFKMRAKYHPEGRNRIIVTALPHTVSGEKTLESIAGLMTQKKAPMIENIRDESDHENPTRIVIELKRDADIPPDDVMGHLFHHTDLEKSYRINLNILTLEGKPKVLTLKEILEQWVSYRKSTVRNKLSHLHRKISERLHIIEGFLVAYSNIDRIIEIIRTENNAINAIIDEFGLSKAQATSILEMRLKQLAKLEEHKLLEEREKLVADTHKIEAILGSEEKLNQYIISSLKKIRSAYESPRITSLVERKAAKTISAEALIPSDPVTVILSKKGWIKMGKGHSVDGEALNYKNGDAFMRCVRTTQDKMVVALSDMGKIFSIPSNVLPSARTHGDHITKYAALRDGDRVSKIYEISNQAYLVASEIGFGFIAYGREINAKTKTGKQLINTGDSKTLDLVEINPSDTHIITVSHAGYVNVFEIHELPVLTKGKGNRMISLKNDRLIFASPINLEKSNRFVVNNSQIEINKNNLGRALGKRARRGMKLFSSPVQKIVLHS